MIDSIGKITLYVNNQNEARDFWTEKMGFIVRLEQQMGADQKWLEVEPVLYAFAGASLIVGLCIMAAMFALRRLFREKAAE